jgi:hypothetical protein
LAPQFTIVSRNITLVIIIFYGWVSTGGGKGGGDIDFGVKMKFNDEIDFYVYR